MNHGKNSTADGEASHRPMQLQRQQNDEKELQVSTYSHYFKLFFTPVNFGFVIFLRYRPISIWRINNPIIRGNILI